ncbi:Phosphatidylglycerol--prolipoprotein diacylglyceryl transferase [Desulfonema limicola]|uniref:Phosphatidylglycerol--prolipoprotein diacylglyceryl transferase n=1 Tax=Desulfonema limicola TaxID=45656 RepID=A0A975GH89_9BACT|nr:prolipoprotein diacylglyceryl transferase [Desulfonema limicola]QTA81161.1 Phosphatidylglycerol--prolipoprotein diacylglyceryl transferase [Desulfonema limicola]
MNEFWKWWQNLPGQISPVIFELGGFKLQYYGLMYLAGFAAIYSLVMYRVKNKEFNISSNHIESLSTMMIIGVLLGGRLGYVIFYNLSYYLKHPLEIFIPFSFADGITFTGISGMSYHGGLIGVIAAAWIFSLRNKLDFWEISDLYVPAVPLGYTFGRLGNFINGELYGRITTAPFGMYFPYAPGPALRHPSQLYEAFFEGIFLFVILWNLRKYNQIRGAMIAFYLMGYGIVRFFIEFFREPDAHMGFIFLSFSAGQVLCSAMVIAGAGLYLYLYQENKSRMMLEPVKNSIGYSYKRP